MPTETESNYDRFRQEITEQVERGHAKVTILQKRPYTTVKVSTSEGRVRGIDGGLGFAKVQFPDEWDPAYGVKMALVKAIADLAKRIVGRDVPTAMIEEYQLGLPDAVREVELA